MPAPTLYELLQQQQAEQHQQAVDGLPPMADIPGQPPGQMYGTYRLGPGGVPMYTTNWSPEQRQAIYTGTDPQSLYTDQQRAELEAFNQWRAQTQQNKTLQQLRDNPQWGAQAELPRTRREQFRDARTRSGNQYVDTHTGPRGSNRDTQAPTTPTAPTTPAPQDRYARPTYGPVQQRSLFDPFERK